MNLNLRTSTEAQKHHLHLVCEIKYSCYGNRKACGISFHSNAACKLSKMHITCIGLNRKTKPTLYYCLKSENILT